MANQNSIYAPTPFAIAKGGTGNTVALTDGQLWIGDTATPLTPARATLTPGAGITITNGSGTITIAAPASDPSATVLANPTTSQTLAPNSTYICTNTSGGITTFTLPTVPVAGEFYRIVGGGSLGWKVAQNASQQVFIGALSTTSGVGGSVNSTTSGGSSNESITIWCQSTTVFLGEIAGGQVNLI